MADLDPDDWLELEEDEDNDDEVTELQPSSIEIIRHPDGTETVRRLSVRVRTKKKPPHRRWRTIAAFVAGFSAGIATTQSGTGIDWIEIVKELVKYL